MGLASCSPGLAKACRRGVSPSCLGVLVVTCSRRTVLTRPRSPPRAREEEVLRLVVGDDRLGEVRRGPRPGLLGREDLDRQARSLLATAPRVTPALLGGEELA